MKVRKLYIHNFRSLGAVNVDCAPGVNVIAGVNGAGKSTLLNALEIALSWAKARLRLRTASGFYPEFTDIKNGAEFADINIVAESDVSIAWKVVRISSTYRGHERPKSDLNMLTSYADCIMKAYHESDGNYNLPMFVKYSVNRSLIDIPTHVHKKHILDAMSLYESKLDGGSNLRSFYEWYREREDIEREERDERKTFEYQDKQLVAVRKAISEIMPGYGELHTRRKSPAGFELRKNGEIFRVEQLSDGEKCYLTLAGDIARRLAICNPTLRNPLKGEGIILIDELELHLHPKWQGEVIDRMRATFPNCQFFVTTHSPHIVQNLRLNGSDSLIVLVDGNVHNVRAHYGLPVDDVLREVFHMDMLRPESVKVAINSIWALLNNGVYDGVELDDAMKELKRLVADSDPEFAKINIQIAMNKKSR